MDSSTASDSGKALELHLHGLIEKLPPSSGYTLILVIVDRLSKQSLLIPTHDTITSQQLAHYSFFTFSPSMALQVMSLLIVAWNLYPTSSVPRNCIWDMKLHFTSGYHPEGDGQTNELSWNSWTTSDLFATTNKTIGQTLPLAEFTWFVPSPSGWYPEVK